MQAADHETPFTSLTVGKYTIDAREDDDGQLTLFVRHATASDVFEVDPGALQSGAASAPEYGIRLTCDHAEAEFAASVGSLPTTVHGPAVAF